MSKRAESAHIEVGALRGDTVDPPKPQTGQPARSGGKRNVAQRRVIYGRDHAGPLSSPPLYRGVYLRRTAFALLRALKGRSGGKRNVAQRRVIYGRDHAGPLSSPPLYRGVYLRRTAFALLRALKGTHHVDAIEAAVGHPVDDQRKVKTNDITEANRYVCGSTIVSKNSDGMRSTYVRNLVIT